MRHLDDERLTTLLLPTGSSIRDALRCIDQGGVEIALALEADGRLRGVLTDGDIRRALLAGASLEDPVAPHLTTRPITVGVGTGRAEVLELMQARSIAHVPEVDSRGRLQGLHLLRDVIGPPVLPNTAVIMAGGRGTRLGALTEDTPKPMLHVAGRPILERIVLHLVGSGIRRIVLSIAYLGDVIVDHFGDGRDFGCSIEYLREDVERPLGTGGALGLLAERVGPPADPLLVMNGDLLVSFSVPAMLDAHVNARAALTVGTREYIHDVPFGVLRFDERARVTDLVEKPRASWAVNGGTYVLDPGLIERIPLDRSFPITELVADCIDRDELVLAWPLDGDWQDIGRPHELRAARGD